MFACLGKGSHIVGGELFYNCLGNNQYQITLKLYRDCNCAGANCADYGDPEYVTIFNASGGIVQQIALPKPPRDTLQPTLSNPCMVQPDVCVEQAIYTGVVTLLPLAGGYDLVYQRCCRTTALLNLAQIGGLGQGATYISHVPDPGLAACNSAPHFNSLPPMYLCANAPLSIDCSATDPDGDVLVYSLCDPYDGASANCPNPSPAGPTNCPSAPSPPYNNAAYNFPYSSTNFTNNPPNANDLTINPQTGLLSGTPNNIGIFDITVCVSEYRNGQLLSVLRRDFQFSVTQCNIPIAAIPQIGVNQGIGIFTIDCKSLKVDFVNNTYNPPPSNIPLSFHWDFGVFSSTSDTSNQTSPSFTYPDTGTYIVHLIAMKDNGNGQLCADTTETLVYVYPTFKAGFETDNVCQYVPAVFTDKTVSTSGNIAQWSWNFGDSTSSGAQNPNHTYANPGTYTVTLIDLNVLGCTDTVQHNITIYPEPLSSFYYDTPCVGSPVQFTNTSTGNTIAYLWNFGNGDTSNLQSPVYTYNSQNTYTVSLIELASDGCKDTIHQNISVHPLPVVSISNDTIICPFTSAQLQAQGGVAYLWSPAASLNDATIANPVAAPHPPNGVRYTVIVTSQFQCTNSDSIFVSFLPFPQISAGADTSVCLNQADFHNTVPLHATGGVSYVWFPSAGLSDTTIANPIASPSANTTYYVTGTDINGCKLTDSLTVFVLNPNLDIILQDSATICFGDTAFVTVANQGASSYFWNPTQYLTNPNSFNTGFYPPDSAKYILTITNYCYSKSDTISIIVWPLPQLNLSPLDSVCLGDSIQLHAQNAATYVWRYNATLSNTSIGNPYAKPVSDTKYIVSGASQYGCINKDSTFIRVYLPSYIQIFPQVPFICLGSGIHLYAAGALHYLWSPASSLSSDSIADPVASPADTTLYTVNATNMHGCKSSASIIINVQMPVIASAPSPYDICKGIPLQLHASGGSNYSWTPDQNMYNPNTDDPFETPDSTTNYVVTVSNNCFADTAVVVVNIHPLPFVDAGPDTLIYSDTYAYLHGTTYVSNYFWNPSLWIDDAFNLNTTAAPPQTMWYELFAIDAYGCENKDSVLITVEPYTLLDVPTGFSPNGDGMNDIFRILRHLNIAHLSELSVFDRWGERVFFTDNINEGWDGNYKGKPEPLGVYVWMAIGETEDGTEFVRKGNVTLIR